MFATLLALGLSVSAVYCEEFSAEVRLLSSRKHENARSNCDMLITRSSALWNNGGFRNCLAGLPIETKEGGFIIPYVLTVNTERIKNFAGNAAVGDKFAFINRKLNMDEEDCVTVTGPNWDKVLRGFATSYPVEIHYTTAAEEDINCTTLISSIRKASPLLRLIDCQHEVTKSETAQTYHHRFEVNMHMPNVSDLPVTETILLQLFWIQRMLEFKRTNCTPISVPIYDSESKSWSFTILLNGNQEDTINCNTIRDRSPCSPKSCEFKVIPRHVGSQVLCVRFEASLCGQLVGPAENSEAAFRFNSLWNRMNTGCPVIIFGKTKDAFDKVPHERYYSALVSGPSNVDVCKEVKKSIQYSAYICEEIQKVNRISADKRKRTFRMRLKQPIYLADIPWHMNEHSKFVHFLNSRSTKCKFNGYVQLNETEEIREAPGHTTSLRFP